MQAIRSLKTIGLMSGTSLDGVDAAWVETDGERVSRLGPAITLPYAPELRRDLRLLLDAAPGLSADDPWLADVVRRLTERHAEAVIKIRDETQRQLGEGTELLGFHGQTILHRPAERRTWQVGDPRLLAQMTGISVAYDFRSADVAAGGQGAPLVPAFHAALFTMPGRRRAIVNLGGIGNVTVLDGRGGVTGYDTGPANILLDAWCQRHQSKRFDARGAWAGAGKIIPALLETLLGEPWFATPPPRSTGRDLFNLPWLEAHLQGNEAPIDVQATLLALTVESVRRTCIEVDEIYLCGGGTANSALVNALAAACAPIPLDLTDRLHLPAQAVEAAAFAWLARERLLLGRAGRPAVTGARGERVLGAVWPAPPR
ncbi:MAG: anhydro-N-acetylmuramic acid kinase [Alphaproteobacteria bacterium]|nr:anhydro-N-acetylmuramic acid kinase [Alphaproteobacteria bacterium]